MLQDEIKLMISAVINDNKTLNDLYKKGFFSYLDKENCKGNIAIINNKAIVSILEDIDDDSKVIATINFKNSGTFIYKVFGKNYYFGQFGQDPYKDITGCQSVRIHMRKRDEVIEDINNIRKRCIDAEEKSIAIQKSNSIFSKFNSIQICSNNEISEKDVFSLLQDTLDKLNRTRQINEVNKECDLDR